jgi:transaldolase
MSSYTVAQLIEAGDTLAAADRILITPEPGKLAEKVDALLAEIKEAGCAKGVCQTLLRLGMNFAGRDAALVGYGADEAEEALVQVLAAIDGLCCDRKAAMAGVVEEFLADMKSVNKADSLPGLLAERIEPDLCQDNPGRCFLELLQQHIRSGVYWQMIGERYGKFGNDFARGLEYLRHYGFCQVSTNPVLAAKAFDEDPKLHDQFRDEIRKHPEWQQDPEAHRDEMALAATLYALWPNLSIFRPLANHTQLRDYMVSFQLNPNIADDADASITDARGAYKLAADYLTEYDRKLGVCCPGKVEPCMVFKVAAGHDAARKITTVLNTDGIGTNNTVVYTVGQEVQLILDAFEGKAAAAKAGKQVVRTYETNMGGRFVSHLREVEAATIFVACGDVAGKEKANALLDKLAAALKIPADKIPACDCLATKARAVTNFAFLKTLENGIVLQAARAAGATDDDVRLLEADLKKAGTLVARRVWRVFFNPANRDKWIAWLQRKYEVTECQAAWILDSMDVLPASKRVPEDTLHTLTAANMCNTEFPNHARAVQRFAEQEGFDLAELREAVMQTYCPKVAVRLSIFPDFNLGHDLTPGLKDFLVNEVGIEEVLDWGTRGIEPGGWPEFGSVQKTLTEFRGAYDAFAGLCVGLAREVATAA